MVKTRMRLGNFRMQWTCSTKKSREPGRFISLKKNIRAEAAHILVAIGFAQGGRLGDTQGEDAFGGEGF